MGEPKQTPRFRWTRPPQEFPAQSWIESKVFGNQVTRVPVSNQSRERLIVDGAGSLRDADLLAILVRSAMHLVSIGPLGESLIAPREVA